MPAKHQTDDTDDPSLEAKFWLPTCAVLGMTLLVFFVVQNIQFGFERHKDNAWAKLHRHVVEGQRQSFDDIRAFLAKSGMGVDIEAVLEETSIILRLSDGMLFAPDDELILPAGFNTLNRLKELFLTHDQQTINIRGHTDDRPLPPNTRFRDNGELSALRAVQVLRHLLAQGIEPHRLTATGFGALEPLFPNSTIMNRAKNRRIEFVLERRLGKE